MAEYYIIRDTGQGLDDFCPVWNWKKREWAVDFDALYLKADGFVYYSLKSAKNRAAAITGENVRVVTRDGLRKALDLPVY